MAWLILNRHFARELQTEKMPNVHFHHETVLLRQLRDVDMKWQRNKIQNLKIAVQKLDGGRSSSRSDVQLLEAHRQP